MILSVAQDDQWGPCGISCHFIAVLVSHSFLQAAGHVGNMHTEGRNREGHATECPTQLRNDLFRILVNAGMVF